MQTTMVRFFFFQMFLCIAIVFSGLILSDGSRAYASKNVTCRNASNGPMSPPQNLNPMNLPVLFLLMAYILGIAVDEMRQVMLFLEQITGASFKFLGEGAKMRKLYLVTALVCLKVSTYLRTVVKNLREFPQPMALDLQIVTLAHKLRYKSYFGVLKKTQKTCDCKKLNGFTVHNTLLLFNNDRFNVLSYAIYNFSQKYVRR